MTDQTNEPQRQQTPAVAPHGTRTIPVIAAISTVSARLVKSGGTQAEAAKPWEPEEYERWDGLS